MATKIFAWGDQACYPGQVKLAQDMGAAKRSIRTYLKELKATGILEIQQRSLGKTNLYRLHLTALRPAHSRRHIYVTCYTEGFSHFVTSMTAPVASGWSGCRLGLAPTGKRRLVTAHT